MATQKQKIRKLTGMVYIGRTLAIAGFSGGGLGSLLKKVSTLNNSENAMDSF